VTIRGGRAFLALDFLFSVLVGPLLPGGRRRGSVVIVVLGVAWVGMFGLGARLQPARTRINVVDGGVVLGWIMIVLGLGAS
jgi:hypothetical protein